ncbi:MAG: 2-oxoacid:acceptor oxidoreductase subunit alpha [Elusimicrobia bacterium]|nr:2-oxoacid:acceptor oxidoreductase subunit alpha [Elusimicrobiota bacterium]MBD3411668.1 2-oxoacid:acceptor oxidoreductase subunit alpha [Elusimicrobiota bacterium]
MKNELTVRIAGEAGQGMKTIGSALCMLGKKTGLHIFSNYDYMSRIRGGNNYYQVRFSRHPVYTLRSRADIIVALDKNSVTVHKKNCTDQGILVLDREKFNIEKEEPFHFNVPFYRMAKETGGKDLYVNAVAFGMVGGFIGVPESAVEEVMEKIFAGKSQELIDTNTQCASAGYRFSSNNKDRDFTLKTEKERDQELVMNGNDAIALGAIAAGCSFYSAYPMTPSTSIMNVFAHNAKKKSIVVEQAEDEIAAVNMVIGASFAGCRAMCATSGGGFALMQEGVSLAGMTETPVVIVDSQRPAPATGFPTRTEQADLDFVIHAGHGEFARAVFSPGSIDECFYLTRKAFDLADKYQIPVIILTDQHLADSYRNIYPFDTGKAGGDRYIISKKESKNISEYRRYQDTTSGISPRAIPSWISDVVYADSDEHDEEGHITERADVRITMVKKRLCKKMAKLIEEIVQPVCMHCENADTILVGFGSTFGVMRELVEVNGDKNTGMIHLPQIWPFPSEAISRVLKNKKKIVSVENNAAGQLARLIRRETGIEVSGRIKKFDGRPFDIDFFSTAVQQEVR